MKKTLVENLRICLIDLPSFGVRVLCEMGFRCSISCQETSIRARKECRKNLNDKRYVLSHQITYLVLPVAGNKDRRHGGRILDAARWRFSYGLFGRSDRTTPPARGGKCRSQWRRSKWSGGGGSHKANDYRNAEISYYLILVSIIT